MGPFGKERRALLQIGFHRWGLLKFCYFILVLLLRSCLVVVFLSCWVITLLLLFLYSNKYFYVINPYINPCSPSTVHPVRYPVYIARNYPS